MKSVVILKRVLPLPQYPGFCKPNWCLWELKRSIASENQTLCLSLWSVPNNLYFMCHYLICWLEMRDAAVRGDEWWEEHVYTLHIVSQDTGTLGREDLYILSCLLVDFLFHHKTLNFPLKREFRDLPEGLCLGGIQTLPYDPFSAPFHTHSVSPAVRFLALHTKQGCLIIPRDGCKNAWIHGSPTAENLLWRVSSHFR